MSRGIDLENCSHEKNEVPQTSHTRHGVAQQQAYSHAETFGSRCERGIRSSQGGQQVSKQAISERLGLSVAHDWLGLQAGKKAWLGKPASQAAQYYGRPSAACFIRKIGIQLPLRLTANS